MALDFAPIPRPDEHYRSTVNLPLVLEERADGAAARDLQRQPGGVRLHGWRGVLYTDDGGETWHPTSPSFTAVTVTALDVMPGGASAPAIAGSATAGLFSSPRRRQDLGVDRLRPTERSGETISDVIVSPEYQSDRTVFAVAESGVWVSTDGGTRWSRTSAPEGSVALAFSPDYAPTIRWLPRHLSTDSGATWDPLTPITGTWTAVALSADYPTDDAIWAGTTDVSLDHRYGVYRSTDGGIVEDR